MRENELLDYYHSKFMCENNNQIKTKKTIMSRIKKKLSKMYSFHFVSWYEGKSELEAIERMYTVGRND